ncbi:hypothetical protein FA95DRAFT_1612580 [Auriscalpium vulgare]|uniref:Uncharacterized protein n=1 Tax=Auriscalpium vulgare TaxID=40419 RepID=A0ACB8R651_9AGAM|nr:hypothetical protein FA95DRAFT_1612580 [Auriscalpium vulgare]
MARLSRTSTIPFAALSRHFSDTPCPSCISSSHLRHLLGRSVKHVRFAGWRHEQPPPSSSSSLSSVLASRALSDLQLDFQNIGDMNCDLEHVFSPMPGADGAADQADVKGSDLLTLHVKACMASDVKENTRMSDEMSSRRYPR